jgi:hypothetical protein
VGELHATHQDAIPVLELGAPGHLPDGRGRILTLTRDAITQMAEVHPKVELVQQRLLDPLSPLEREGFLRDLARVAFEDNPPGAAA